MRSIQNRLPEPTEDQECEAFVQWLELRRLRFGHIPQETYTKSWRVKMRNKRMGVRSGLPDYLIVIERPNGRRLLFIEMKRKRSSPSNVSPAQREWIADLGLVPGVTAVVCKGYDEAVAAVEREMRS